MKIAMFGGTFNPIHNSHIYIMQEALKKLALDKILVVPTYSPPHKTPHDLASTADRLEMCRLAIKTEPRLELCDYEIKQADTSYTYETVEWIKANYQPCELFLIIGSDMFLTIEEWKNPQIIYKLATLCVFSREQDDKQRLLSHCEQLEQKGVSALVLDSKSRPMSSTEIRAKIKADEALSDYLPNEVVEYIKKHKLYN